MTEYRDPITGYTIRRYTEGPGRNSKLYFTTENFTPDDRYFFFNRYENDAADDAGVYRADVQTGELRRIADLTYSHFVLDRVRNVGYVNRNESEVYEVDLTDYSMKKLFDLPEGGRMTCHITAADTAPGIRALARRERGMDDGNSFSVPLTEYADRLRSQ